jgi:periplasmic divalent cation tolerance protein
MGRGAGAIAVLVTCASPTEAKRIATSLVEKRLAACGNILSAPVTSIYRWKGRVQKAKEVLLILKSTRRAFSSLEREVRRLHSYDVPEIIALPIELGSAQYLSWIEECTSKAAKSSR